MDQQTDILDQLDEWYEYAENSMHVPMLSLAIRGMRLVAQALAQWALLDQLNEYDLQLNPPAVKRSIASWNGSYGPFCINSTASSKSSEIAPTTTP